MCRYCPGIAARFGWRRTRRRCGWRQGSERQARVPQAHALADKARRAPDGSLRSCPRGLTQAHPRYAAGTPAPARTGRPTAPAATMRAAAAITTKPSAMPAGPRTNFIPSREVTGCAPQARSTARRTAGAKTMMNTALSDWNQPAGTSRPPSYTIRIALGEERHRGARLLEADQNTALARNSAAAPARGASPRRRSLPTRQVREVGTARG